MLKDFFSLTPELVLAAAEQVGERTTGLCYPLGSLENRVYELELEHGDRIVVKFYRPGRWSREALQDEHRYLEALKELEIPVVAPRPFSDGKTLAQTEAGIYFTAFPRVGGRSPDELLDHDYGQLGRLLGRIHNVGAALHLKHRPTLSTQTYGHQAFAAIEASGRLSPSAQPTLQAAMTRFLEVSKSLLDPFLQDAFVVHADCHRGNLLRGRQEFFFLDFDDAVRAPAVQDMWLLLPARLRDCPRELDAMLEGYTQFRPFDMRQLKLVEVLRGLRYIRYAGWVASRIEDPAFAKTFSDFGSEVAWQRLQNDIYEQIAQLESL